MVDYFIHRKSNKDYRPTDHVKFRHADELLKMMASITRDDRFLDVLYDEEGGKPKDMCEVLDRVEANGIAIGEAKGVDKARLESIKTVMKKLKYDVQQAMDFLDVPVNDQAKDAAKISG